MVAQQVVARSSKERICIYTPESLAQANGMARLNRGRLGRYARAALLSLAPMRWRVGTCNEGIIWIY